MDATTNDWSCECQCEDEETHIRVGSEFDLYNKIHDVLSEYMDSIESSPVLLQCANESITAALAMAIGENLGYATLDDEREICEDTYGAMLRVGKAFALDGHQLECKGCKECRNLWAEVNPN